MRKTAPLLDRALIILLWLFCIISLITALRMMAMPLSWYESIPGVSETGPFNGHFILDIGIAFLTGSMALGGALALPTARRPPLVIALVWFGGHALLHLSEILTGGHSRTGLWLEVTAIILPAVLMLLLLFRTKRR